MIRGCALALAIAAGCSERTTPPAVVASLPARPIDAATVDAPSPRGIVVRAVTGRVERQRGGAVPELLRAGDRLALDERIRTGAGATATLEVGDLAQVEVAPRSQVAVAELTDRLSRVRLQDGRVAAQVRGREDARLRVEVEGSSAVAESQRGRFAVLSSGAGQVTVAATDGRVTLTAHDRAVELGAGQQSIVRGELGPSAPERIPPTLFLKVGRAGPLLQRERQTVVNGTTAPGAVISVNGVRIGAGGGTFTATVALREGENRLVVEAEDAGGRRAHQRLPSVTVDSRAPQVKTQVTW